MSQTSTSWTQILRRVSGWCLLSAVFGGLLGAVFQGWSGMLGFIAGSALVYLWILLDVLVARRTERNRLSSVAPALLGTYVLKVLAGFALLFVPLPTVVLNGWMLAGAIIAVCIWLCGSMHTIMGMRILYFDEHDESRN